MLGSRLKEVEEVRKDVYYKERVLSARLRTRRRTLGGENSILSGGFCCRCKLFVDIMQAAYP